MGRILRWLGIGLAAAAGAARGENVWFFRMDPRPPT
jgi:hypothetical protein